MQGFLLLHIHTDTYIIMVIVPQSS